MAHGALAWLLPMPRCAICKEEVDELTTVTVSGKKKRVCEDCASRLDEDDAVAQESEAVVQRMMDFKGRR